MKVFKFFYNLFGLILSGVAVVCFIIYVILQHNFQKINIKKGIYDLTSKWESFNILRQRF
jgi:hypothetical protein